MLIRDIATSGNFYLCTSCPNGIDKKSHRGVTGVYDAEGPDHDPVGTAGADAEGNFRLDVSRVPDPAGDRVLVTLNGKFLPYQW